MIRSLIKECESELTKEFATIDETALFYSEKVLKAMQNNHLSEGAFTETTGYGYN
ncbi:MAG: methionine gamma-lyase family protein, partial [Bacilli bacterium]|nr:methionine gamma-lyase family protein [Bacilli bacterium]